MIKKKLSDYFLAYIVFIYLPLVYAEAFFYAPPIKELGETGKVIFFHVPCSWIAVLAFLISAVFSVRILNTLSKKNSGIINYDIWAASAAQIGFLFTVLATVTGSI